MRPERLVLIAGTGTEIGKTWVAARLLRAVRGRGTVVAARKPAQSFAAGDEGTTDADVLAAATGEAAADVCPAHRWYPVAMAPPMAAAHLGAEPFTIGDLVDELQWPDGVGVGVVETAGGVRSPLADDGDAVDLVRALGPDAVVLVADAGLGTINAVRLSLEALAHAGDRATLVVLNRFDPADELHQRNRSWLVDRAGADVVDLDELTVRLS
jgi:dethiobiotin synthetase